MRVLLLRLRWLVALGCLPSLPPLFGWNSALVAVDSAGRLSYAIDADQNRIPDFSHAGYRGGGVPLPVVPVVRTLAHAPGDQTSRIQAALDAMGTLPVQSDGYRGALQLGPGTWEVAGTLRIRHRGVVLAGVGDRDDPVANTILRRTGTSQADVIQAGVRNDSFRSERPNSRSEITTAHVPVAARSFQVDRPELYQVGDAVIIWHPSTQAWLDAVNRGGVTDNNYWRPGEIDIRYHRHVTAIAGDTITVDAPVFNHLVRALSQSYLYKYNAAHVVTHIGIEKLQVVIETRGELTEEHAEDAITFMGAQDSWIRDCTMKHFWHAGVQFEGSTRCTAVRCRAIEPHSIVTGSRRYNFSMYQSQLILVQDCFADRARHAYVCNGTSLDSGIVFLDCISDRSLTASEGHRRWGTGFLFDNLVATNRQATDFLGLYNRGTYGTGHGWASAHSVAWNVNAAGGRIFLQKPPTAQNYAIGCSGNVTGSGPFAGPAGHIEGTNRAGLEPRSLYLAQLAQRLAESGAPLVTAPPAARTVMAGETVILPVAATGIGLTYQWSRNGSPLAGATAAELVIENVTASHGGEYTVTVTGSNGRTATARTSLTVAATNDPGRLVNLAIRASAGVGAQTLIVGAVVGGPDRTRTQPVLVRAAGPALAAFGVDGALADPALTLYRDGHALATNDDWGGDATVAGVATRVGAFAFAAGSSRDAALYQPAITPGTYSIHVTAASGAAGVALAEIYDATVPDAYTAAAPRLVNLSARTAAGAAAGALIAGFAVGGSTSKTVLLRAIGPGLAPFGVTGLLGDPSVALFAGSSLLAANENWGGTAILRNAARAVGAFDVDLDSADAALIATLPPGSYTAQVSGATAAAGVALVEIYLLTP